MYPYLSGLLLLLPFMGDRGMDFLDHGTKDNMQAHGGNVMALLLHYERVVPVLKNIGKYFPTSSYFPTRV